MYNVHVFSLVFSTVLRPCTLSPNIRVRKWQICTDIDYTVIGKRFCGLTAHTSIYLTRNPLLEHFQDASIFAFLLYIYILLGNHLHSWPRSCFPWGRWPPAAPSSPPCRRWVAGTPASQPIRMKQTSDWWGRIENKYSSAKIKMSAWLNYDSDIGRTVISFW